MTILKGIPRVLPPSLLHILAKMGHGDTLVIADANFPAASVAACTAGGLVNCDGSDAPTVLRAITKLLPLDPTCSPVAFMALMPEHAAAGWKTPIKAEYKKIAEEAEGREIVCTEIERFAFYEAAKKAYAVVSTGETAFYANVILTKGIIGESGK